MEILMYVVENVIVGSMETISELPTHAAAVAFHLCPMHPHTYAQASHKLHVHRARYNFRLALQLFLRIKWGVDEKGIKTIKQLLRFLVKVKSQLSYNTGD